MGIAPHVQRQQQQRPRTQPQQQQQQQQQQASQRFVGSSRRSVLGLTAMAMCACCQEAIAGEGAGFTYGEQDGPPAWGATCATGLQQSPVNITRARAGSFGLRNKLSVDYNALSGSTVSNTGHGAQVNVGKGNFMEVGETKWQLVQYHFHTPSEHAIDGRRAPMEVHLVHQDPATGKLAVVGVMLEVGPPSRGLQHALTVVPEEPGAISAPADLEPDALSSLLPPAIATDVYGNTFTRQFPLAFTHYQGSLTTPPCSEVVQWFVLNAPATVAAYQVLNFQRLLGFGMTLDTNSRPLQPLQGRGFDYEGLAGTIASKQ